MKNVNWLVFSTNLLCGLVFVSGCGSDKSSDAPPSAGAGGSSANVGASGGAGAQPGATGGTGGSVVGTGGTSPGSGGNAQSDSGGTSAPNGVFDCNNKSPDLLGATVGAGWELVESFDSNAGPMGTLPDIIDGCVAVSAEGRVVAFTNGSIGEENGEGKLEEWGTWPNIAPTGKFVDPRLPQHSSSRFGFNCSSVGFDEGMLILTYTIGGGGPGGVFIDDGKSPKTFPATDPGRARRVGDQLLVAATGFLDQSGASGHVWRMKLNEPAKVFTLLQVNGEGFKHTESINLLGEDVLFGVAVADSFSSNAEYHFGLHRFTKQALSDAATALTMPEPAASIYKDETGKVIEGRYAFNIDGGVAIRSGIEENKPEGTKLDVVRNQGGSLSIETALTIDKTCMSLGYQQFAVNGEPVIEVADKDGSRLVHLRPRR